MSPFQAALAHDTCTVHWARIAAACAFDDGSVYSCAQDKGLEYSTSVPAEVKLFVELQRRRTEASASRPVCALVLDHLGVWHAPCGQARAPLSEYGYNELRLAVWCEKRQCAVWCMAGELAPAAPQSDALLAAAGSDAR